VLGSTSAVRKTRGETPLTTSIEELHEMAAECRELASIARQDVIREQLLDIAEQFERLAQFDRRRARMLGRTLAD